MISRRIFTFSFKLFYIVLLVANFLRSRMGPLLTAWLTPLPVTGHELLLLVELTWFFLAIPVKKFMSCVKRFCVCVGIKLKFIWIYCIECELLFCLKLSLREFDALIELLDFKSESTDLMIRSDCLLEVFKIFGVTDWNLPGPQAVTSYDFISLRGSMVMLCFDRFRIGFGCTFETIRFTVADSWCLHYKNYGNGFCSWGFKLQF